MNALAIMEKLERGELTPDEADYELLAIEERRARRKRAIKTLAEVGIAIGIGLAYLLDLLSPWLIGE